MMDGDFPQIQPKRGRPRKDSAKLATWIPPEGWVRVVAWVSPEERRALKRAAVETDASVAELIRSLAQAFEHECLSPHGLIHRLRERKELMEKIPTIFERDQNFKVTDKPKPNCEWVFTGEGLATEKLDGMNIRLTIRGGKLVRVEKRRNPSKADKARGIVDGWYVDADEFSPEDRYVFEAARNTDLSTWPDGEHSCEALGPKIQGNPLGLEKHLCVPFNIEVPVFTDIPRTYDGLRDALTRLDSRFSPGHLAEGIVFHHPDGRRAKIKRKDFKLN